MASFCARKYNIISYMDSQDVDAEKLGFRIIFSSGVDVSIFLVKELLFLIFG